MYFVKSPHCCPTKAVSTEGITNMLLTKDCWNSSIWSNKLRRLYFRQKFVKKSFILEQKSDDNDSIMADRGLTNDKELQPLNLKLTTLSSKSVVKR